MGFKKLKKFIKKVAKPVAAIAAIAFPPLIPAIGTALGATGAAASIVGAAALGAGSSLASGDSLKTALTTGAISGLTAGAIGAVSGEGGLFSGAAPDISSGTGLSAGSTGTGLTAGSSGLGLTAGGSGLGITAASSGVGAIGGSLGTTLAGISTGIGTAGASALASDIASKGLFSGALEKAASITGLSTDTLGKLGSAGVQTLLSGYAAKTTADKATEAAQITANAQIEASKIAADAAKFRPVGVTTRFGASKFGFDDKGNLTSAGYTPSAEISGYQDRLRTLAAQGLTDAEGARAAYQPLTGAAQSLFGLGQDYLKRDLGQPITSMGQQYMQSQAGQPLTQLGQQYIASDVGQPLTSLGQQYLSKSPDQVAADYISKQQALINPSRQTQLADVQNRLFQQGRSGAAVAQGGSLMPTSPELAAYYNALAQQDLTLAAGANQAGQQQTQFGADLYARGLGLTSGRQTQGADLYRSGVGLTQAQQLAGADLYRSGTGLTMEGQKFGAGLFDTGAALQGKYYSGQAAAYQPFATAMDTTAGLERLAAEPLALGTQLGARTTAASAEAGRLLSGGMTSAAATMAPSNAYSLTGDVLSGVSRSPLVTGAINSAFGVQSPQRTYTTDEVLKLLGRG